jgi:hypothetical protein
MPKLGFIARLWFYFRTGYSTYLTFLLGYASTLVTVYYLAIKSIPPLLDVFPRFVPFAVLATVIGVPLSIAVGWVHLKRGPLYASEAQISFESNPYYFKAPPGYWKEVVMPSFLELLLLLRRLVEAQIPLPEQERSELEGLEKRLRTLMEGGYVGNPRRSM